MRIDVDRLVVGGAACVVAGGFAAAATRPLDLAKVSWLSAYLVLVCGVALIAIAVAQQHVPEPIASGVRSIQTIGWIGANIAIVAGSLASLPLVVDAGSLVLLAVVALTAWVGRSLLPTRHLLGYLYLAVLAVIAVSIPIGMVLAHVRG